MTCRMPEQVFCIDCCSCSLAHASRTTEFLARHGFVLVFEVLKKEVVGLRRGFIDVKLLRGYLEEMDLPTMSEHLSVVQQYLVKEIEP